MSLRNLERIVDLLAAPGGAGVRTVDLTGGAPELHPGFRRLVRACRDLGRHVIDRCNLTVLLLPGQEDTARFLAEHEVEIVASLPCYSRENVDDQRGRGVFEDSLRALRRLNRLGYGREGSGLVLSLVYNPGGPILPPPQPALEADYRRSLFEKYGIVFDRLLTMTNMPIRRFRGQLRREGNLDGYRKLLRKRFEEANLDRVMCRSLLSMRWDGRLFDCDFNQALDLPVTSAPRHIDDVDDLSSFDAGQIRAGDHCFGCTAGAGSSCTGALI